MSGFLDKQSYRSAQCAQREQECADDGRKLLQTELSGLAVLFPVLWNVCLTFVGEQLVMYGLELQLLNDAKPALRRGKRHVSAAQILRTVRWCVENNWPATLDTVVTFCEQCPRLRRCGRLRDISWVFLALQHPRSDCLASALRLLESAPLDDDSNEALRDVKEALRTRQRSSVGASCSERSTALWSTRRGDSRITR
jgi:hypothetical protein